MTVVKVVVGDVAGGGWHGGERRVMVGRRDMWERDWLGKKERKNSVLEEHDKIMFFI